jgi:hypothetical protein
VQGKCDVDDPELAPHGGSPGHVAACHFPLEHWPMSDEEMRRPGTAVGAATPTAG